MVPAVCKTVDLSERSSMWMLSFKIELYLFLKGIIPLLPYSLHILSYNDFGRNKKKPGGGVPVPCSASSLVDFSKLNSTAKSINNGTFKCSDSINITHFTLIHTVTM